MLKTFFTMRGNEYHTKCAKQLIFTLCRYKQKFGKADISRIHSFYPSLSSLVSAWGIESFIRIALKMKDEHNQRTTSKGKDSGMTKKIG